MRRDPRVTLLCYDPRQPLRYLEVRGTVVEMTEEGAGRAPRRARLEVRGAADPLLRRRASRRASPRPRSRSCAGSARPTSSPSTRPSREARDDHPRRARDGLPIPASHLDLLTRPDLRRAHDDGRATASPSRAWSGSTIDGECARVNTTLERQKGRNMLANPQGQPARRRPRQHRPLHPDPRRRRARHRGRARAPRRADAQVHAPSPLLRTHLPGRAAGARDAGHLPHPRAADHPRRDPRLRRGTPRPPIRRSELTLLHS